MRASPPFGVSSDDEISTPRAHGGSCFQDRRTKNDGRIGRLSVVAVGLHNEQKKVDERGRIQVTGLDHGRRIKNHSVGSCRCAMRIGRVSDEHRRS